MARERQSEIERNCLETSAKNQERQDTEKPLNGDCKHNSLRVRFLDEEGKTERTVTADVVDYAVSRVKNIHILKNHSSSDTSVLLRNPSLIKRRSTPDRRLSDGYSKNINNNSSCENLNDRISVFKSYENQNEKTENEAEHTKENNSHIYKKNCNVYSVNQAKTITSERKKIPLSIPRLISNKTHENVHGKAIIPEEVCLADGSTTGKDFTIRTIGRLSRGLGRLLRRTNSVRISEPDPVYKVAYLGNVLTGWARGDICIEKPLATLWRNYQQTTKRDVVMKLSVTNSGLKGFTKEHGLTEYWSHRITYCASPPHYPKLFCWVYRHEGKKLKHELRCHAVLCTKESVSKKITEELKLKLKQALVEFKKDRICKQNARLSLANSLYENPSMPRRKILLSVGALNYRPPLERSKSAPKLGAIEELWSEEDEEEAEMNSKPSFYETWMSSMDDHSVNTDFYYSRSLDRRRSDRRSPRKLSCPEGYMNRTRPDSDGHDEEVRNEIINLIVSENQSNASSTIESETSHNEVEKLESRVTLESISETNELNENNSSENDRKELKMMRQSNFLVTDSDDGSVSSGCETASTVTSSDAELISLQSHFSQDEMQKLTENKRVSVFERIQNFERAAAIRNSITSNTKPFDNNDVSNDEASDVVNHVPIGEKNGFRRRSTYPPLRTDLGILTNLEDNFESLIDNLTDIGSLNCTEAEVYKNTCDNVSACSDESGYSELLDNGKESLIGNTIMI